MWKKLKKCLAFWKEKYFFLVQASLWPCSQENNFANVWNVYRGTSPQHLTGVYNGSRLFSPTCRAGNTGRVTFANVLWMFGASTALKGNITLTAQVQAEREREGGEYLLKMYMYGPVFLRFMISFSFISEGHLYRMQRVHSFWRTFSVYVQKLILHCASL
jgi:hypothetical protein